MACGQSRYAVRSGMRVDAELPSSVGSRGDYAPLVGPATHHHRFALQRRSKSSSTDTKNASMSMWKYFSWGPSGGQNTRQTGKVGPNFEISNRPQAVSNAFEAL